jgi:hypothetical protein
MKQEAPYPAELDALVAQLSYKPGWSFTLTTMTRLQGGSGLTLLIQLKADDVYGRGGLTMQHHMPVPAVHYDRAAWQRWLLDQVLQVERHETLECFTIAGERVFVPAHHEGSNQYLPAQSGEDKNSDFMCGYVGEPAR